MQKIVILPICLGILLVGIVMIPNTFAGDGCGPGTVLIDGVCELAPANVLGIITIPTRRIPRHMGRITIFCILLLTLLSIALIHN
jgi:hypothetical protein